MSLVVVSPGLLALVQDAGRPGFAAVGVSSSGAFDQSAFRQVNLLLGNNTSPAIEVLGGGLALRAQSPHAVAVTGGVGPLSIDGIPMTHGRVAHIRAGQTLTIGSITSGLRAYLGVAGGFDVPTELGSASTDVMSQIGPPPLQAGDTLHVGSPHQIPALNDITSLLTSGEHNLAIVMGPRDDWFTAPAVETLLGSAWRVGSASNRVGVRLEGPVLDRSRTDELPSEPCVRGSVQVSSDGAPIIFGPDHPTTGGYPVIAVVTDSHVDRLAQARPGDTVRFNRGPLAF